MTVAYDAVSKSGTGLVGASPNPMTWTHTPVGTPRGVLVFAYQESGIGSTITGPVTYGGVAMQRVAFATQLSGGEGGAMDAYFLGSGLPTGAQTVSVTHNASSGDTRWIAAITVTAADDTEIIAADTIIDNAATDPTFTFDTGSRSALRFLAAASGEGAAGSIAGITGSTAVESIDTGARGAYIIRADAAASGSSTVGATAATEDVAVVGLAVAEVDTTKVRHDVATVGSTFTTTSPNTFNHTPIGTPKGVLVWVYESDGTDTVTAVTYGGVSMTRVGYVGNSGHAEPGSTTLYFLGSGIPTGTQSVSIAHTGSGTTKQAVCQTLVATADTLVIVSGNLDTSSEQFPSLTLDSGSDPGLMVFGGASGETGESISTGAATLYTAHGAIGSKGWIFGRAAANRTGSQSLAFKNRAVDEAIMFGAVVGPDSGKTGTIASTLATITSDFNGQFLRTGTIGSTLATITSDIAGVVSIQGTIGSTLSDLTAEFVGSRAVQGTIATTITPLASNAAAISGQVIEIDAKPWIYWVFYRTPDGDLALVESTRRLRRSSWSTGEGHELVSERFRTNLLTWRSVIDTAVADAWAAESGSAAATLQTAIHAGLTAAGIKRYDGTTLT